MTAPSDDHNAPHDHGPVGSEEPSSRAGATASDRGAPSLRADPGGPPPTDWREPPWFPPRDRDRGRRGERGPQLVSIIVGLILVLVGVYYFLDRTLGIAMPPIAWGSLWPVLLILLGGLILLRSGDRWR